MTTHQHDRATAAAPAVSRQALPGAPHPIRRVGPPDAPFGGVLARVGDAAGLLVDAAALAGWPAWDAAPDGHVAGPLDIVRRPDGQDVVLPVCTERLDQFLSRRRARAPLSSGEGVTLAVSVLRGCTELFRRHPDATGAWWLTDTGRPVFVVDVGCSDRSGAGPSGEAVADATGATITALVCDGVLPQRPADRALAALRHARALEYALEDLENDIFALAEPAALATTVLAPARVRDLVPPSVPAEPERAGRHWHGLASHVDADLADLASRVVTDVWRHLRRRRSGHAGRPSRRRAVLAAAGAGGVVLVAGLMWPGGGTNPATAQTPAPPASASPVASPSAVTQTAAPSASPEAPASVAAAAGQLLDDRLACGTDSTCRARVQEDAATRLPGGAVDLPSGQRRQVLLDDFGGAAVLRVESVDAAVSPQLLVIVQQDRRWLIRDVRDAADQRG